MNAESQDRYAPAKGSDSHSKNPTDRTDDWYRFANKQSHQNNPKRFLSRITQETSISITVLLAIVASMFTACGWIAGQFQQINNRLNEVHSSHREAFHEVKREIEILKIQIDQDGTRRWSKADQREWTLLLKQQNPTLSIPLIQRVNRPSQ